MSRVADSGSRAAMLPDGRRLHLHHGPIDLIIEADGVRDQVAAAYAQATAAFRPVLAELVEELVLLRAPVRDSQFEAVGPVARRMVSATRPHTAQFVTPMAAVAGAVADHVLAATVAGRTLTRAYVNNGGDIAFWLAPGRKFEIGIVSNPETNSHAGVATVSAANSARGIATSGWRGRSMSLGIADAVTVLADNAADADVAATLIANAVDLPGSLQIESAPARTLYPDSDLGDKLVTTAVHDLAYGEIEEALKRGRETATVMQSRGLISAATLCLQGQVVCIDPTSNVVLNEAEYEAPVGLAHVEPSYPGPRGTHA